MTKISDETKNNITDAAVMQSVAENQYIRDYCKSHPNSKPTFDDILREYQKDASSGRLSNYKKSDLEVIQKDMGILNSFSQNHTAKDYVIQDVHSFGEGCGNSVLISNGNNAYVTFNGTGANGWIDNGQGMYMESTKLQRDAADQFDKYCRDYPELMNSNNNIVVAGHSKGGNKAMYVTMSAKYSYLIDNCVALDGQGFSQAAINKWQSEYSPDVYNDKISKITLVAGKNDFVNQLGIPIAGTKYYVDYDPWYKKNIIETLLHYDCHAHYGMFVVGEDGLLTYDFNCKPGPQDAILQRFMSEYMKLDPAEIEGSAPQIMALLEMTIGDHNNVAADGEVILPQMTGVLWALAKTSEGRKLVALLLPWLIGQYPQLSVQLTGYAIQLGLKMLRNEVQEEVSSASPAGSQLIMLNVESFQALNSSFQIAFERAKDAARYAEKAERVQHDATICGALTRTVSQRSEDISEIMRKVIESFTNVDKENAKAAQAIGESYLGPDIYHSVGAAIAASPDWTTNGVTQSNPVAGGVKTPPELEEKGIRVF